MLRTTELLQCKHHVPSLSQAFLLKSVETLLLLSQAHSDAPKGVIGGIQSLGVALSGFGRSLLHRFGAPGSQFNEDRIALLKEEAEACGRVCQRLRRAALLLDEVSWP